MTISLRITKNTPRVLKLAHSNMSSGVSLLLVILATIQSIPLLIGGFILVSRTPQVRAKLECERNYPQKINCKLSQVETTFFRSKTRIISIEDLKGATLKVSQSPFKNSENTNSYNILLLQKQSETLFTTGNKIEFGIDETTQKVNIINAFIGDPKQINLTVYRQKYPILLQSIGIFLILLALISFVLLVVNLSKSFSITFDKSTGTVAITNQRIGKVQEKKEHLSRVELVFDLQVSKNQIQILKRLEPLQPLNNLPLDNGHDSEKAKKKYYYIVALALKSGQYLFLYNSPRPVTFEVNEMNKFLGVSQK